MLNIDLHPFPEITTSRLHLRQLTQADTKNFFELRSNDEVMKYIDTANLASEEAAAELISKLNDLHKNNEGITWGIFYKDQPELIGIILYKTIDKANHRAEVGYLLGPQHWRKGIVEEALKAVLHFGFTILQLHSIEAFVNPGNEASISLLEKNKFVREALFKENHFFDGKFLDMGVYSLLKKNYTPG